MHAWTGSHVHLQSSQHLLGRRALSYTRISCSNTPLFEDRLDTAHLSLTALREFLTSSKVMWCRWEGT